MCCGPAEAAPRIQSAAGRFPAFTSRTRMEVGLCGSARRKSRRGSTNRHPGEDGRSVFSGPDHDRSETTNGLLFQSGVRLDLSPVPRLTLLFFGVTRMFRKQQKMVTAGTGAYLRMGELFHLLANGQTPACRPPCYDLWKRCTIKAITS